MRTARFFSVALALLSLLGMTTPAHAQPVYYWLEFGRAAFASWEDRPSKSFALVWAGQGVIHQTQQDEPLVGEVGCAQVEDGNSAAFGCGELSAFTIDDNLGTAAARGIFDAEVFDLRTEKTKPGKISFSVSWKASAGNPRPRVSSRYQFQGVYFVGTDAGIARDASRRVTGGVTASAVGRGPRQVLDARIQIGGDAGIVFAGGSTETYKSGGNYPNPS